METEIVHYPPQPQISYSLLNPVSAGIADAYHPAFSGWCKTPLYIMKWDRIIIGHYGSNKISLWDAKTLDMIDSRYTHEQLHFCLTFSDKQNIVYSSGLCGRVTATSVEKNSLGYYWTDIVSDKIAGRIDKILCIDKHDMVACASNGSEIYLLDSKTLTLKGKLSLHENNVRSEIIYIEKNDCLAVVGGDRENYIYMFSLKDFKCMGKTLVGFRDLSISALKFCSLRNLLVVQPKTREFRIWKLNPGYELKAITKQSLRRNTNSAIIIEELDCFILVLNDQSLQFHQLSTSQLVKTVKIPFYIEEALVMTKENEILVTTKNLSQIAVMKYT